MAREFTRKKTLKPFGLDLDGAEALIDTMLAQFSGVPQPDVSFKVEFPGQTISATSVSEIRQMQGLPAKTSEFSVWVTQHPDQQSVTERRTLRLMSFGKSVHLGAESGEEKWSKTAFENVFNSLPTSRGIVHRLASVPWFGISGAIMTTALIAAFALTPLIGFQYTGDIVPKLLILGTALFAIGMTLVITGGGATLTLSSETPWWRVYGFELGMAINLLSLALSIVAFFF